MSNSSSTPAKGIPIGLIGPEALVQKMVKVIRNFPSFDPIARGCTEEEVPRLAEETAAEAEVLLLSGPMPYGRVRQETRLSIPVHYVPLTDTGLFRALYRLKNKQGLESSFRLTIDTLSRSMVENAFKEIEETLVTAVYFDGPSYTPSEELIRFHRQQYEEGGSQAALTAEECVSRALTELGIPNEWVVPTDSNITVALERALLSTETRKSKEAQIVVGMVNVDNFGKSVQQRSSEHEIQKLKLEIHRTLLDYVESLDGCLTPIGSDEYLFFTTRGIFERETGGYKSIPLARSANKRLGLTLSMGVGFGRSANEAGTLARSALRRSKEAGGNACFILREDHSIIGPLEMAAPVEQAAALTDPELIRTAEEAGMTSAYLSRLMNRFARTGVTDYTVHELADILDITVRSMHRLLLQWMESGLVEIAGMEKVPKGRPRQIYRLVLLAGRSVN
ncbi:hypothetical protein [Saccharibacillus deserti]|uniref:hypothetical protein n=1 Tax=Saccharibacillus deserti TaxID=1634444 RepID=UPI001557D6D5|nr:hypothetical protein [Saccharibacillus deserti]